jgi:hypothetical protein
MRLERVDGPGATGPASGASAGRVTPPRASDDVSLGLVRVTVIKDAFSADLRLSIRVFDLPHLLPPVTDLLEIARS